MELRIVLQLGGEADVPSHFGYPDSGAPRQVILTHQALPVIAKAAGGKAKGSAVGRDHALAATFKAEKPRDRVVEVNLMVRTQVIGEDQAALVVGEEKLLRSRSLPQEFQGALHSCAALFVARHITLAVPGK